MGSTFFTGRDKCWGKAGQETPGYEEDKKELQEEMLEELNLSDVEEAVDEAFAGRPLFSEYGERYDGRRSDMAAKRVEKNRNSPAYGKSGNSEKNFASTFIAGRHSFSLMAGFSSVLEERQIGEVSFYIVYLFLFVLLLKNFESFASQIGEILEKITEFMRVLLPAYFLALSASDGISTAGIFYQMIIGIIFLVEHLILKILLPGVRFYFLIELMNYLTKKNFCLS